MNNTLSKALIFVAGAAIGSVVAWKITKTRCDIIKKEELDSMEEYYSRKYKCQECEDKDFCEELDDDEDDEEDPTDEDLIEYYDDLVKSSGYIPDQDDKLKLKEKEGDEDMVYIEIIDPDAYGEEDYPTESLDYYEGDNVLTYCTGGVVEDPSKVVGADFASHFGDYGDRDKDTVFVRNHTLGIDFEILRDHGSYSEVH